MREQKEYNGVHYEVKTGGFRKNPIVELTEDAFLELVDMAIPTMQPIGFSAQFSNTKDR